MKSVFFALIAVMAVLAISSVPVMADPPGNGGVGICPNPLAADDDGDGIPNGQDPDYVPPRDGTGSQRGSCNRGDRGGWQWWSPVSTYFGLALRTLGWGPGDGTGNGGVGPHDGTGYGPGYRRHDDCDRSGRRWR